MLNNNNNRNNTAATSHKVMLKINNVLMCWVGREAREGSLKKGTQKPLDPALGSCDEVRKITGIEIAWLVRRPSRAEGDSRSHQWATRVGLPKEGWPNPGRVAKRVDVGVDYTYGYFPCLNASPNLFKKKKTKQK